MNAAAARVTRLAHPSDTEVREALSEQVDSVIVCSRDDAVALRLALVVLETVATILVLDRSSFDAFYGRGAAK